MKTVFTYLTMLIIPATVAAQPPVINHGDFYYVGDVVGMVNCDITGLDAGAAGANVSWDFTGLVQSGPLEITRYTNESSSTFLTSNLVAILPNGMKKHLQQSSTDTYINGMEDTTTSTKIYYRSYPDSRRPFTYNDSYVDTFAKTNPTAGETGIGIMSVTADAYGTLKLPTGTFNNVLRVKKSINEIDTLGSSSTPTIVTSTTVTYVYMDTMHRAPLLRIDSVTGTLASSVTAKYLSATTGITHTSKSTADFNANLNDNDLLLVGRFDAGATYDVTVYNIIGSLVFTGSFSTTNGSYRFDINKDVLPGIYIVTLQQANDPESKRTIKVLKQ